MALRCPSFGLRGLLAGFAAIASIGGAPTESRAAEVTQMIDAEITVVGDDYAPFFDGAERLVGSLTYEDADADTNPSPDIGTYPTALVSLTVAIPSLGFGWSTDAGSLWAYLDRFGPADQFSVVGLQNDATGTPINGYPIRSVELALAGDDLLTSEAPPGPGAIYEYGNLFLAFDDDFGTIVGRASIVFAPEPARVPTALAVIGGLALAARVRSVRRA